MISKLEEKLKVVSSAQEFKRRSDQKIGDPILPHQVGSRTVGIGIMENRARIMSMSKFLEDLRNLQRQYRNCRPYVFPMAGWRK